MSQNNHSFSRSQGHMPTEKRDRGQEQTKRRISGAQLRAHQRREASAARPSLKIGEIGEMVGYADTAHFARVFKKIVGMSANEYRNSHS